MPSDESSNLSFIEHEREVPKSSEEIYSLIYFIRGKQVMIDSDLATLYGVDTRTLNQAVKRNINRFPEEFRFQLNNDELENLKSQSVIPSWSNNYGGRRSMPYVFTEQGIAMLSAVLRSETAIKVSIRIMETFVEIRQFLSNNAILLDKVNSIEAKQIEADIKQLELEKKTEKRFEQVFDYISSHEESNQRIFYDGQIFDAFSLLTEIIMKANRNIVLIDGYVDIGTLNILAKKKDGVNVLIYTLPSSRLTAIDIATFNSQYPSLEVKRTTLFHDRFLVLDDAEGYHIGASLKDAGKKCFGINRIEDISVIKDIIEKADIPS